MEKKIRVAKKSNLSTNVNKSPILGRDKMSLDSPWLEDYQDFFTHRMQPVSHAFLERLGAELVVYAETTKKYHIEWFFTQKRIDPRTARKWADKYEDFRTSYRLAKQIIGMRREEGALEKRLDAGIVSFTMPRYDDEWKELVEWKAKLKAESEAIAQPTTVIFKNFE